jgi:lipopolysaccharide transport system permease protein
MTEVMSDGMSPAMKRDVRSESEQSAAQDETVIIAGRQGRRYLKDIWRYRELFVFLAWRDILVRYKQTVVGVAWSVMQPMLTMFILAFVFGRLGGIPSGNVPYQLLVFCGLLPWQFFSVSMASGGSSLVGNASLVSKVYFPRILIPASSIVVSLVDFTIAFGLLIAVMIWFQWMPPMTVFLLPLFVLLAIAIAFGAVVWVSALMVQFRDFRFIVPVVVQLGLYVSPVGFPSSVVPEQYQLLYALNPMVGVIDGFRACLLGGEFALNGYSLLMSVIGAVFLVVTGVAYFRHTERHFADVI